MGKANGVSRRRRKNKNPRFVHRSKLKKQRSKSIQKPKGFECKLIRDNWNPKISANVNLKAMGLALDPNKVLSQTKDKTEETMDIEHVKVVKIQKKKDKNTDVVMELEKDANKPKKKNFRFGPEIVKFCIYMIEKYGEDYDAMAMDKRNHYQESSGQIKQKIKRFKSIPVQWNAYLKAKQSIDASNMEFDENDK